MDKLLRFVFDYPPDEMSVERVARIFEAGDYPDKGISISEEDLDVVIENFVEVPVKLEHVDSPLDPLGAVKSVWRKGKELFARLAFPKDLATFLERRGIRKLSIALNKNPLRLAEVSLVLNPRVPSAAMFGRDGDSRDISGEEEDSPAMTELEKDRQIRELKFALRSREVDSLLADMKRQGKIVPASEPYAREILLRADEKICFENCMTTVAEIFTHFLEAQPKVITFEELAPGVRDSTEKYYEEDNQLLMKLGVSREQVKKYSPQSDQ